MNTNSKTLVNIVAKHTKLILSKDRWRYNPSSLYTGVRFSKEKNKLESSIYVNGKSNHLGYFLNEELAGYEYNKALDYLNEHSDLTNYSFKFKRKKLTFLIDTNQLSFDFALN